MNRLTSRERLLLVLFLSAFFVVGNVMLLTSLGQRHARLRADLAAKRSELHSMKTLLAESGPWAEREAWLAAHLPPLSNPEQAGVKLLEQIKTAASAHGVLLESPELGGVETQSACRSVAVQLVAKSSWENLIRFLHAMQQPDRFIVFEDANLQADPSNPSQMLCRFKIAQWYAL